MADPDEVPGLVVAPNSFSDGLDGITVVTGYNGEPRIKCMAGGYFQVGEIAGASTGAIDDGCSPPTPVTRATTTEWIVNPNGYSIVGKPNPPTYPNGQNVILSDGSTWPPAWWPSSQVPPSTFSPGIPNVVPDWATSVPGPAQSAAGCDPPANPPAATSSDDDDDDDDDPGSSSVTRTTTRSRTRSRTHR